MEQRLNYVTLAVRDLARARAFYVDGLGWRPSLEVEGEVVFLPVGAGLVLSLWAREGFVEEVGEPGDGLAPFTLAHNVATDEEVDTAVEAAVAAGGTLLTAPERREWGGYSGYVADPDGTRWEVAHNPSPEAHEQVAATRRWLAAGVASPAGDGALGRRGAFSGFSTDDVAATRTFYAEILGLGVSEQDGMLHLDLGTGAQVLVYPKDDHEPAAFTVLNLEVADIDAAVDALVARGVELLRYDGAPQDERGVMRGYGPPIAWFRDPGRNVVAVLQL